MTNLKNRARNQRRLAGWSFGLLTAAVAYCIFLIQGSTALTLSSNHSMAEFLFGFLPRLTLIVLVLFLAQFFLSVFRYAVKMASHNEARSDVLLLAGPREDRSLKSLMATIAPDRIDFGKEPKVPADVLVDVTKAVSAAKLKD